MARLHLGGAHECLFVPGILGTVWLLLAYWGPGGWRQSWLLSPSPPSASTCAAPRRSEAVTGPATPSSFRFGHPLAALHGQDVVLS